MEAFIAYQGFDRSRYGQKGCPAHSPVSGRNFGSMDEKVRRYVCYIQNCAKIRKAFYWNCAWRECRLTPMKMPRDSCSVTGCCHRQGLRLIVMFAQLNIPGEAIAIAVALNSILDFIMTSLGLLCLQAEESVRPGERIGVKGSL